MKSYGVNIQMKDPERYLPAVLSVYFEQKFTKFGQNYTLVLIGGT